MVVVDGRVKTEFVAVVIWEILRLLCYVVGSCVMEHCLLRWMGWGFDITTRQQQIPPQETTDEEEGEVVNYTSWWWSR